MENYGRCKDCEYGEPTDCELEMELHMVSHTGRPGQIKRLQSL